MKSIEPGKWIVFDSDVIIHFIKSGFVLRLKHIYPENRKIILDKLLANDGVLLGRHRNEFQNLMWFKILEEVEFPESGTIIREYANLTSNLNLGKGESACLAYARFTENVIASSNLRDIKAYCEKNAIDYLTTMDLLEYAHKNDILTLAECDEFIYNVISKGSRLPYRTMEEFYANKV
jgi:hypothetical protein